MAIPPNRLSRRNCLRVIGLGVAGLGLAGPVFADDQAPANPQFRHFSIDQTIATIATATGHYDILVDVFYDRVLPDSVLKDRRPIKQDEGILYTATVVRQIALTNAGVPFPTDILFIARDGRIIEIHPAVMANDQRVFTAMIPVKAALQVLAGTVMRLDIVAGDFVLNQIFGRTL
jgi:uncharacterized protein